MTRSLGRLAAVPALLLGLATAAGFAQAHIGARLGHRIAACHLKLTQIAHGQGSPDDLAWDGRRLLVSDIDQGTVGVVAHGHVRTLVKGIRAPEGIVPGPNGSLIVAAQGTNRVLEITHGRRTTLARLPLKAGQEGIDSINAAGPGAVYVPDSARGRLYVLQLHPRKLRLLARGLVRPVAAINWHGAIVVADEYANAVWRVDRHGRHSKLAALPLPDDLTVVSGHLIAVSLVGAVWEVAPHLHLLTKAFEPTVTDPQGLAGDGRSAVIVADQGRNGIYRISHLAGCL